MDVALIGCGAWGRHILRDLRTLGADVHVVARSEASVGRAREGGAASVVAGVDELPAVRGVVVCTPITTHEAVLEEVLQREVPVFVEKPLTDDAASAARLAARASEHLFVMDKWRYHPGVERLGALAASGELGPVIGLETTRIGWGHPHHDADAVWVLAPHDLSIALQVLGVVPEPRHAVADVVGGRVSGMTALLGDPGHPWLRIEVSTRAPVRERSVRLLCEEGVAALPDPFAPTVVVHRQQGVSTAVPDPEEIPVSEELPLLRELAAFLEFLDGGPPPRSSAAEGAEIAAAAARLRTLAGIPPR